MRAVHWGCVVAEVLRLYGYWRSSAAYRVRIALNLKGLVYDSVPVHLARDGGEQFSPEFTQLNPQSRVPVLMHGSRVLRQSLAIIEYLDETWPSPPLLPVSLRDRARVRAIAQLIACDIHPLNNVSVMRFLEHTWAVPRPERDEWIRHWIREGFRALEAMLVESSATGSFCEGDVPTLADCCLVPQVYNAHRYGLDMSAFPTIERINTACLQLPEFDLARPEVQPDATGNG